MKRPDNGAELKIALKRDITEGHISLGEAVRRMRKIVGMTQKEYAEKVVGISPRIFMQIERGEGNPTIKTLNKVGRPFGYKIGFIPKRPL